jgi:site-specific DNA recombinase
MRFGSNDIDYADPSVIYQAVIYTRVSDRSQMNGASGLASQETRAREYARYLGIDVAAVFSDQAVSGKILDRPDVRDMLKFLSRAPEGTRYVVLIDDISRLARDVRVFFDLRDAIHETGALLESPTMKFKHTRDADGNFYEGIQALGAQHYREKVAETTRDRSWARLMKGYWVFHAPIGYKYKPTKSEGSVLIRDEPVASIVKEALEGYASGRFVIQAEVQRFLETQPAFTRRKPNGRIRPQVVSDLLAQPLYAGYLESKTYEVPFREARHEPLISLQTFEAIKARRKAKAYAPARKDISADFPLRGFVTCGDCGAPYRSGWSKSSTGKRHAYYLCQTKGCESYGKSIRRDGLEEGFATLLGQLTPAKGLFVVVKDMLSNAWSQRTAQAGEMRQALKRDAQAIDTQIDLLLNRIVETTSTATITAYERKIEQLEKDRLLLAEKLEETAQPKATSGQMLELCLAFLASPWKIWNKGDLALKKTVLRLVFSEPLAYVRNEGYRTPKTTLPFKVLADVCTPKCKMVPLARLELALLLGTRF